MKYLLTLGTEITLMASNPPKGQNQPLAQGKILSNFLDEKRVENINFYEEQNVFNSTSLDSKSGEFSQRA